MNDQLFHSEGTLRTYLPFLLLILISACGAPANYTILNANSPQAFQGATSWPNLKDWESGEKTKDVAVIVAIEDYAFLPDVTGAVQNANDWESYFRKSRGMENVFVLSNQDAPIEEINRFLKQGLDATQAGGRFWFVFIGHGAALDSNKQGVLVGMDAQQTIESLGTRSLAKTDLVAKLKQGKQSSTVVLLDTCFSGRDASGELLAQGTQPVIPVSGSTPLIEGVAVLAAAKGDQVAGQLPGAARPAFSYLLLGALRGWGDANGDGQVSTSEAIQYAQQQMRYVKGRQQTPDFQGSDVTLASNASEKDPGIDLLMQNGGAIADQPPVESNGLPRVDTNKGLIIDKIEGWGLSDTLYATQVASFLSMTSGSGISILKNTMSEVNAAAQMQNGSYQGMEAPRWDTAPEAMTIGPYTGTFSIRSADDFNQGVPTKRIAMFSTYRRGSLWSFTLESPIDLDQTADIETMKSLVETAVFK